MKLHLCAIGRLRKGPEKALIDDYLDRAGKTGRALGLGPCTVSEAEAKRGGGMAEEADLLARMIPDGAKLVCLDERGKLLSSPQLADQLGAWRDEGIRDTAFVIGGADGIDPALRGPRRPVDLLRQDGLAAHAGARHAVRTDLPRHHHPRRIALPPRLTRGCDGY